jgi:uncharacterized protein (TIGR02266 family)
MTESQDTQSPDENRKTAVGSKELLKKILLVDDVKLFLALEKTFFQRKSAFTVLTAGSGKEALEIVAAEQPDLIFMDLYMPGMDGDECCRFIKTTETGKNIPVIIVTSAGKEEEKNRCLAAGCDEIITKPVNRSLFLSVAKKYIEVHDRKEPRYASHIKIKFGLNEDELLTDYTVNLNTGGLFLTSSQKLRVDTPLFVELSMPENACVISCQARVAWVNEGDNPLKRDLPAGMGVEFVNITAAGLNAIREYICKNALIADW